MEKASPVLQERLSLKIVINTHRVKTEMKSQAVFTLIFCHACLKRMTAPTSADPEISLGGGPSPK